MKDAGTSPRRRPAATTFNTCRLVARRPFCLGAVPRSFALRRRRIRGDEDRGYKQGSRVRLHNC
ncbi:hypothetical protein KCP69_26585 (plasmid) [Salmonella enterica subsp. enterica]|nr:hypothetical protein KCP69_26585 [Salmonella enterica subsp. enterica]